MTRGFASQDLKEHFQIRLSAPLPPNGPTPRPPYFQALLSFLWEMVLAHCKFSGLLWSSALWDEPGLLLSLKIQCYGSELHPLILVFWWLP